MALDDNALTPSLDEPSSLSTQLLKPKPAATDPLSSPLALAPAPSAPPTTSQPAGSDPLTAPKGSTTTATATPTNPIQPPPLATTDPLAFAPSTTPYVSSAGQTFVGGTQPTDANGNVTGSGVLGYGSVPGSNGQLTDLGGGQWAPTPGVDLSNGITRVLDPILPPGYGTPEWYAGTAAEPSVDEMNAAALAQATGQPMPTGWGGAMPSPGAGMPSASGANLVPASGLASLVPSGSPSGSPAVPTGPANGTPAGGGASIVPGVPGTAPGNAPAGVGAGNVGAGVGLTPTTVANALTNSTISPNNTVDRVKLAQDSLNNTIQNILDPQYEANLRDAQRHAFGAGRGVSGQLRTNLGDIGSDYQRTKANLASTLLNAATNGSIEDLYRNIGIAQQQQGFQAGQQQTAFGNALQQLLAGSSGDPSQIALVLAQIYGGQAQNAGNAATNYANSSAANASASQVPPWLMNLITSGQMNSILNQGIPGVQTTPGGGY